MRLHYYQIHQMSQPHSGLHLNLMLHRHFNQNLNNRRLTIHFKMYNPSEVKIKIIILFLCLVFLSNFIPDLCIKTKNTHAYIYIYIYMLCVTLCNTVLGLGFVEALRVRTQRR